jgi:hypothetical protein
MYLSSSSNLFFSSLALIISNPFCSWCFFFAIHSNKVYQLLAHGRCFSPGTPASSTTKTGHHDIAEILLKVALNTINQTNQFKTLIGLSFGTYPQLFLQKKLLIIWSKILYSETYYKSAEDRICNNLDTYIENFKQNLPNTPNIMW